MLILGFRFIKTGQTLVQLFPKATFLLRDGNILTQDGKLLLQHKRSRKGITCGGGAVYSL